MDQSVSRPGLGPSPIDLRDPRHARRVGAALLAALVFTLFTVATKEVPAVYAHLPWSEDPTDTFVSFALFFVPMCAFVAGIRFALCRTAMPPPAARVAGVLGATWVALWTALITLTADWAGLLTAGSSIGSDAVALASVVGLALTTLVVLAGAFALRKVPRPPDGTSLPDGLADALTVGHVVAARLGRVGGPLVAVVTVAERRAAPLLRRHPVEAGLLLSVSFGVALAVAVSREEGPSVVSAFIGAVATCTMFAFLGVVDRWLYLVVPERTAAPLSPMVRAVVVGAAAVPVSLAFRDAIWTVVPVGGARDLGSLVSLVVVAGIAAFTLTLVLGRWRHRSPHDPGDSARRRG